MKTQLSAPFTAVLLAVGFLPAGVFMPTASQARRKPLPRVTLKMVTTPVRSLKVSTPSFSKVATDFNKGKQLLESSPILKKKGTYKIKVSKIRSVRHYPADPGVIFKITLKGPSNRPISAVFKPFQTRYQDGFKELAACKLAAFLRVRQPPCGERSLTRTQLKKVLSKVPSRYRRMLKWDGNELKGFVRLWAPKFKTRIGRLAPSRDKMLALAKQIRPRGRCRSHAMCRDMSDLFVFDFLISNNDRQYNVGTIRTASKKLLLFPIDWGDGFTGNAKSMKRKIWYRKAFYSLVRFRRSLVQSLKRLDRATVDKLTSDSGGSPLISTFQRDRLMDAKKKILKRTAKLKKRYGSKIYFP